MVFYNNPTNASLFVYSKFAINVWILVYVDDMIATGDNDNAVEKIIKLIYYEFKCRDLGILKTFLGIEVTR